MNDSKGVSTKLRSEFTEHQRTVFCVFSGDGVNRLRTYLNEAPPEMYAEEGTMFDDREVEPDLDTDAAVTTMMNAAVINDDDEDMEDGDGPDGSHFGIEGEG